MRIYVLKLDKPAWFYEPPTNRQIKVLKFFGVEIDPGLNKGMASGISARLFRDAENKELWEKYIYHTGDESQDSPELTAFDREELRAVIIPDDWKPKQASGISSGRQARLREIIADMMREGSPFDDPIPVISFNGMSFAFTGKFSSGTRPECQEAVQSFGAIGQDSVNRATDYLIIGSEGSGDWAEGSHGRKIERAMMLRMETGKPAIVSEADWLTAVQERKSKS
jgi:NAD-dependent DNA ligase